MRLDQEIFATPRYTVARQREVNMTARREGALRMGGRGWGGTEAQPPRIRKPSTRTIITTSIGWLRDTCRKSGFGTQIKGDWDFPQIRNKFHLDMILVHEVKNMSMLESESKFAPYIVVNGTNARGAQYPCNVSLSNPIMANWCLYALIKIRNDLTNKL